MPTIDQVYRDNLKLLIKESGTSDAFAERIAKSPSQVSQWVNASRDSKTKKPRTLSREMARHIEVKCGKQLGWMDRPHNLDGTDVAEVSGPAPMAKGSLYQALTDDERRLLDNFRAMLDDDQRHFSEEIASRAAKMRAYTAKVLEKVGASAQPARHAADARQTEVARSALDITEKLRQQSLFDPPGPRK